MPPDRSSFAALNVHPPLVPEWMGYFTLRASPNTDLWRKPPSHDTSTAPILYTALRQPFCVAEVTVAANWALEWDQAGLCIFAGLPPGRNAVEHLWPYSTPAPASKWVKAGLEFSNNTCRATSVCATNEGADWSLASLPSYHAHRLDLRIKLERIGYALWISYEDDLLGWSKIREVTWFFWGVEDKASTLDDANTNLGDFCASEDPNVVFYVATFLSFLNDTVPQALSYHPNNALNSYGWTPPVTGAIASVTTLTTKYPNDPLANLVWGSAASGSGSFADVYPVTGITSWSSYDADKSTNVLQTGMKVSWVDAVSTSGLDIFTGPGLALAPGVTSSLSSTGPPPLTGGIVRSTTVITSYLTTDTATVTNVTTNATVEATSTRWVLETSSAASSGATHALAPPSLACLGANALADVTIILSLDLLFHGLPSIVQFGLTTCLATLITFRAQTVVLAQDKSSDVTTSRNPPRSLAILKPDPTLVKRSCNNGEIECTNGGQSFSMCSNGAWIDMGNVAAGTLCRGSPGVIDYATPPAAPGTGPGGSTFLNRATALFPPSPRALATAWMVVLFAFAASLYWRRLFLLL
ncbi:hypothetical protein B0A49_05639 [Cryomyces minteri]|uniref:Uncharacterized protein n=1 Tax=Cryomyces minteri TaxID=331657 RepID=A0A4U0XDA2_9PEZI|nr:hypothetical protein B0A49_05639 [Cryomyces minteri]